MNYRKSYSQITIDHNANPEQYLKRTLKMQNLLEEYDRQNAFLGSQVKQLLKINSILSKNKPISNTQSRITDKRQIVSNCYNSTTKKYEYLNAHQHLSKKSQKMTNSLISKTNQKNLDQSKKVTFTCQPYIEKSHISNHEENKTSKIFSDQEANSPLKKKAELQKQKHKIIPEMTDQKNCQSPTRKSNLKKKKSGIQVTDRSLSKDKSDLNNSFISNKSDKSKKSGIIVYSIKQRTPQKNHKIDLPMVQQKWKSTNIKTQEKTKTQDQLQHRYSLNTSQKPKLSMVPAKQLFHRSQSYKNTQQNTKTYNIACVQTQNLAKSDVKFKTQTKSPSYKKQTQSKATNCNIITPQPFSRHSSNPFLEKRSESISRHKISPSTQIVHKGDTLALKRNNSLGLTNKSNQKEGKKKFINMITKKLLEEGRNISLKKAQFKQ